MLKLIQNGPLRLALLIIIASVIGLIYNGIRKTGLPLIHSELDIGADGFLSVEQAYILYRQGRALFIDTRYEEEYRVGHIRSALNIPSRNSIEKMMTFLETLDKDEQIVVYCSSIQCNSARRMAGFMRQIGFTRVYVFPEGYETWIANDLPVEE